MAWAAQRLRRDRLSKSGGTLAMPDESAQRVHLTAPCGMDCGVCSAYLAHTRNVPRKRGAISHCAGCRACGKKCAYLKSHCPQLRTNEVTFCYECAEYPCERLKHLDSRYRKHFGISLIENLDLIQKAGVQALIERQQVRFGCDACGQLRSVHNGKCYVCEKVLSWKT